MLNAVINSEGWNEEIVALLTEEKWLIMNGKQMTLTFIEFYVVYIYCNYFFTYILVILFKERSIISAKIYKYLNKLSVETLVYLKG